MPLNIKNNKYLLIVFGEHPKLILHNLQYNLFFQERLCEICLASQREDFREVPQNLSTSHSKQDSGQVLSLGFLCGVSSPRDKPSKQITGRKINTCFWLHFMSLSEESIGLDSRWIHDRVYVCLNYLHLIYKGRWHISVISRPLSETMWDRK